MIKQTEPLSENPLIAAKQIEAIEQSWDLVCSIQFGFSGDRDTISEKLSEAFAMGDILKKNMFLPYDILLPQMGFALFLISAYNFIFAESAKPAEERLKWHQNETLIEIAKSSGLSDDECNSYLKTPYIDPSRLAECIRFTILHLCEEKVGIQPTPKSDRDTWEKAVAKYQ